MRRLDVLIDQVRKQTENVEFSDTTGISDEEFIQYANDGQEQIEMEINSVGTDNFLVEKEIQTVAGQEAYELPFDMLMGTNIRHVEISSSSSQSDYFPLKQRQFWERINSFNGTPAYYIQRNNQILLQPKPDRALTIRVQYKKKLPRLDIRRASVSAVTLGSNTITSLTFDTSALFERDELIQDNFLTIVDRDGAVKMRAIPFDDINSGSGVVTVTAGFTFESGESIGVGDYAVRNKNSSTHSQLPDICERFIISYMAWKILKRDSNTDLTDQERELIAMGANIVKNFARADENWDGVPIINNEDLDYLEDF